MARSALFQLLAGILFALLCSLSQSAPLETEGKSTLVKRNSPLYDLWSSIPATQIAKGDSALAFAIDQSVDNAWGITYLYGCVALIISDPNFVIVAHVQQVTSTGTKCIQDAAALNKYLQNTLQPALDTYDAGPDTRIDLFYDSCDAGPVSAGIGTIKTFLTSGNFDGFDNPNDIFIWGYSGGGLGVPDPNSPAGLAVVEWQKPALKGLSIGTLKVFFGSAAGENPLRDQLFVRPATT